MRLYGLAAVAVVLGLGAVGAGGCTDNGFCYECGQGGSGGAGAADGGPDALPDQLNWDVPVNTEGGDGSDGAKKCPDGWADCNLITLDGCEVNLQVDLKNCGTCSNACALAHAEPECKAGKCEIKSCTLTADGGKDDWQDCDKKPDNGCESDIKSDSANCGGCGKPCPAPPHATAECVDGVCGKISCDKGFADCNQNIADGCEADLLGDPSNCGECSKVCAAVAHGLGGCTQGVCGVGTCDNGYADCDASLWSGCETVLATDVNHCGSCLKKCGAVAHGLPKCEGGQCLVESCDPGYADCNGVPTDGCEVNLADDVANCAACDNACPAVTNGTPGCAMFTCGIKSCNAGWQDCFGGSADGCETDTQNDVDHCGSCTTVCPVVTDGFRACELGVCKIGSCDAEHADCNGVLADGCEAALQTDINNCGVCNTVCPPPPGATAGCNAGQCGVGTCTAGFADCNQNLSDGCELNITTDWNNCGACGAVCGSHQCVASACVCTKSVLVIPDDSASGTATLTAALTTLLPGWTITTATKPSYQYDGASPAPTGFGAVVVLAGGPGSSSYSTDMPANGQTALVSFVQAANGLVLTEWAAKHVADGRWQTLKDLVLLTRTVAFSGQVQYKLDPGFVGHPIWTGLTNNFTFASTSNVGVTKVATGVKRIAGSPEAIDAVAVREVPSEGRVVHVAHAGNYAPNGWSNANIQKLLANAVSWSARCQ